MHLHALVAGGALTQGGEWKTPKRGFLFPVKALSRVFRGKFMARLAAHVGSAKAMEELQKANRVLESLGLEARISIPAKYEPVEMERQLATVEKAIFDRWP